MPASDSGVRRVSVHAGTTDVDLALPAGVPLAVLIPSIVDILDARPDGSGRLEAKRYQLSVPGGAAMDTSTTLGQNDVRDGDVLVLTQSETPLPAPHYVDVAEAVLATLNAARAPRPQRRATRLTGAVTASCLTAVGALALVRNTATANAFGASGTAAVVAASAGTIALVSAAVAHRSCHDTMAGLVLSLIGIAFAAAAGFLAVPGAGGIPNALLAAAAAVAASVSALRAVGCGAVTLTAVASATMLVAVAAVVGVVVTAPLPTVGSVFALTCLGLLGLAPRLSIAVSGLSPRLWSSGVEHADTSADKAFRADNWLTSLIAAFSSSAAAGAVVTVLAGPRPKSVAFAVLTAALLLLRARPHAGARRLVLVVAGVAVTTTAFANVASAMPSRGAWIVAATAVLAAAAIFLGFVAPALSLSPVVHRGVEVVECLMLAAMVPLTCWVCGLYSAVRGLSLA